MAQGRKGAKIEETGNGGGDFYAAIPAFHPAILAFPPSFQRSTPPFPQPLVIPAKAGIHRFADAGERPRAR